MLKSVNVHSLNYNLNKRNVHNLVRSLQQEFNFRIASLLINFINSNEITVLNKKHLEHHYSTDIITFDYSENEQEIDAEIFISMDDASKNSQIHNVSLNEELNRLVIHGILHLIGFNDITQKEKKIMTFEENRLIKRNIFTLL